MIYDFQSYFQKGLRPYLDHTNIVSPATAPLNMHCSVLPIMPQKEPILLHGPQCRMWSVCFWLETKQQHMWPYLRHHCQEWETCSLSMVSGSQIIDVLWKICLLLNIQFSMIKIKYFNWIKRKKVDIKRKNGNWPISF